MAKKCNMMTQEIVYKGWTKIDPRRLLVDWEKKKNCALERNEGKIGLEIIAVKTGITNSLVINPI